MKNFIDGDQAKANKVVSNSRDVQHTMEPVVSWLEHFSLDEINFYLPVKEARMLSNLNMYSVIMKHMKAKCRENPHADKAFLSVIKELRSKQILEESS